MNKSGKFKVFLHTGFYWLDGPYYFDSFDEASDFIHSKLSEGLSNCDDDEKEHFEEIFLFDSRIEEQE